MPGTVIFTRHVLEQATSRGITRDEIVATLTHPDSLLASTGGKSIARKRHGKHLLRVVHLVDPSGEIIIITAYETSKMEKYEP